MENNENMNNQVNENNNVQEEKKNNSKTIGTVLLIMGLLLLGVAGYKLFIEKPEPDKPKEDNTQDNGNNETQDDGKYKAYDFDEYVNSMQSAIQFKYEYTSEELPRELDIMNDTYNIVLSMEGVLTIKKGENEPVTMNISDVKNIDYCADEMARIYILLNSGDVYEYSLYDFDNGNYVPTKIEEITNATKFVKIEWADCTECGGNLNLGIINNENKYIELDSIGY